MGQSSTVVLRVLLAIDMTWPALLHLLPLVTGGMPASSQARNSQMR